MNNRIVPSLQRILPIVRKYHKKRLDIREKITKSENTTMSTLNGEAIKLTPKIKVMFRKQLPTMFPKARAE